MAPISLPLHSYPPCSPTPPTSLLSLWDNQLILGKVPPHLVLSWAQLERALDLRGRRGGGAVGFPFRFSPSHSQEAALSQAWEQEHTCCSAQRDWEDDLVLLHVTPGLEILVEKI